MRFYKTALLLLAISLFAFACSQSSTGNTYNANNTAIVTNSSNSSNANTQTSAQTDELVSARKIYKESCVKCHKEDGTGGITDIDGTKIKAPNFTSDRLKKESDAEFIKTIENGAKEDGMPAFKGKISDADIKNLVKMIRTDFQGAK
jgi:mono/diheme cytochrome c family protein